MCVRVCQSMKRFTPNDGQRTVDVFVRNMTRKMKNEKWKIKKSEMANNDDTLKLKIEERLASFLSCKAWWTCESLPRWTGRPWWSRWWCCFARCSGGRLFWPFEDKRCSGWVWVCVWETLRINLETAHRNLPLFTNKNNFPELSHLTIRRRENNPENYSIPEQFLVDEVQTRLANHRPTLNVWELKRGSKN